jgi:hypothetical protein
VAEIGHDRRRCHVLPQLIGGLPVYLPPQAIPRWRNAQVRIVTGSILMQLKTLLALKQLLAGRRELIFNWLAVLALLAVGVT